MESNSLVPISEAAQRIGITRQRLHKLIANGQIKAVRLGRYHYIEVIELERYVQLPQGKPYVPRTTGSKSVDNSP
ncbi:MAG: helix-turn-helix domain-containing protein [Chloroflexi bacterium AL-W]|nr:helix-turn-helix domain-containing protein [Chloroflexi bacterium AL-N1]NOK66218.1 helix-turn-helix domain-containing protein [Chloroflexi bacterium AL-N10]NOK73099.1 helix-turn-helix domain-containing protein [Chloroflexi bacterium AL-N5]NOK79996.1 helix-turn-helix domain-containing protein [Chloroflexi bacterium AL-W]NOK88148.1 helix-turn-helix domain-containing protein [Chloroflexi bacterium AL-N15]